MSVRYPGRTAQPVLAWRHAEFDLESLAEMGWILEPQIIGDRGDRSLGALALAQRLEAFLQPAVPYPFGQTMLATFEQFTQVAAGNTQGLRHAFAGQAFVQQIVLHEAQCPVEEKMMPFADGGHALSGQILQGCGDKIEQGVTQLPAAHG